MIFNNVTFWLYFMAVTVVYYKIPRKMSWAFLLLASTGLYSMYSLRYLGILAILIMFDYTVGRLLETLSGAKKILCLACSIVANLGFLSYFKFGTLVTHESIVLPIGLSFHTLQSISYTIEVYKGKFKAETNLGIFGLSVMFFPQLAAGPIERPQNLLPQLRQRMPFSWDNIKVGLKLIGLGLFKKLCLADGMAPYIKEIDELPGHFGGITVLFGSLCYAYQLYADFSGYSDIAQGTAKILGINLMNNFRSPFYAGGFAALWRNWHISLTSWFRDYVYIPLGGNKRGTLRMIGLVILVFTLSGIWHGAGLQFVAWGLLSGLIFCIEYGIYRWIPAASSQSIRGSRSVLTYLAFSLSLILFRSKNIDIAMELYSSILNGVMHLKSGVSDFIYFLSFRQDLFLIIAFLFVFEYLSYRKKFATAYNAILNFPPIVRNTLRILLLLVIVFFYLYVRNGNRPFIYFQF